METVSKLVFPGVLLKGNDHGGVESPRSLEDRKSGDGEARILEASFM